MVILGINTAASKTSIALIEKNQSAKVLAVAKSSTIVSNPTLSVLAEREWEGKNNEAEKLMPEIFGLIKNCGKNFEDLKEIFCVKGPGSFTGLRVGVTVANTMRYLLGAKLYGMDYFEYLWTRARKSAAKKISKKQTKTALLIYAGSSGVYVSLSSKEDFEKNAKNVNINDLTKFLEEHKIEKVFGDITDEQKKFLGEVEFFENLENFGKTMIRIFEKHFSGEKPLKEVQIIKPVYIKKPGITVSKSKIF